MSLSRPEPGPPAKPGSDRPTLISLNRFEAKKNIHLAIRSFASVLPDSPHLRLVIAGGYDPSLPDNLHTLWSLRTLCQTLDLTHHTISSKSTSPPEPDVHVVFILNFSTSQRTHLLTHHSTVELLYTPANEHFGIVPVEAMACGLPVLAADSGGPMESVVDLDVLSSDGAQVEYANHDGTGLHRSPDPQQWATAIRALLSLSPEQRDAISRAGKRRVAEHFSSDKLGKEVEEACRAAVAIGDLHTHLGDKLIWGGAGLMLFAAVNLGILAWFYGITK